MPIPEKFAFGKIQAEGRFEFSDNINPAISWSNVPDGTKSFALIMHDPDVPSSGEDVNQEGKTVPADLPLEFQRAAMRYRPIADLGWPASIL